MTHVRWRLTLGVGLAGILISAVAACGSDSSTASTPKAEQFPRAQFPADVFDGLSGSVAWYDGSGGATTKARNDTIFKDFTDLTGVAMQADFTGDTAKFFATMESGAPVPWSLIEFPTKGDFMKAEEKGYLEPIDTGKVPVDTLEDGTYDKYGVDVMRYGIVLAYNTDKWPADGKHPDDLADLFDTKSFPGKRCMYQYPQYGGTMEAALLADGVAPDQLYPLDVDRAFAKLDTIKKDVVWWSDGDEALRLLTSGECDMGVAWSGRVYNAVTKDGAPLAITWKNAIYTTAVYAVPKGAPNADAGQAAISMWLRDEKGQQAFVNAIPYTTPVKGLTYPAKLDPWLPAGANADVAVEEDEAYYAKNIGDLADRFNAWVSSD